MRPSSSRLTKPLATCKRLPGVGWANGYGRPGVAMIRTVMLWFMLSLGVAIASPLVHPQTIDFVCTSVGTVKAVVHTDSGVQDLGHGKLECALCVLSGAPPNAGAARLPTVMPLAYAVQSIPAARIAAATAAPLPARGPPALS